jgi:hypothetical protein
MKSAILDRACKGEFKEAQLERKKAMKNEA